MPFLEILYLIAHSVCLECAQHVQSFSVCSVSNVKILYNSLSEAELFAGYTFLCFTLFLTGRVHILHGKPRRWERTTSMEKHSLKKGKIPQRHFCIMNTGKICIEQQINRWWLLIYGLCVVLLYLTLSGQSPTAGTLYVYDGYLNDHTGVKSVLAVEYFRKNILKFMNVFLVVQF